MKNKNREISEVMSEKGIKGANARWGKKSVAEGTLVFGNIKIQCCVLNSKERVISTKSLLRAFDMKEGGYKTGDRRLVRFAKTEGMMKHVDEKLIEKLNNPIEFRTTPNNRRQFGYPADTLPKLCMAIVKAESEGDLKTQQAHIGKQARILMEGFATVGVIGLIDEATGYQYVRERNALAVILEDFIAKEVAVWVKTFPDDFYRELFRLRGVDAENLHKRPQYFGKITNDIVYSRLAPGVIDELKKKNPNKAYKHHSWLTRGKGVYKLEGHINQLLIVMKESKNWSEFTRKIDKYLPVLPQEIDEEE